MIECPSCGQGNRPIARFCQFCGSPLVGLPDQPDDLQVAELEATPDVEAGPPVSEGQPDTSIAPEPQGWADTEGEAKEAVPAGGEEECVENEPAEVSLVETDQQVIEADEEVLDDQATPSEAGPEITSDEQLSLLHTPETDELIGETELAEMYAQDESEEPELPVGEPSDRVEPDGLAQENVDDVGEPGESEAGEVSGEQDLVADEEPVANGDQMSASSPGHVDAGDAPSQLSAVPAEEVPSPDIQELTDAGLLPWQDEASPWVSVELGTVLQGRYQVIEVLEGQDQEGLYRVRDLQRCPQCGFDRNTSDEAYCGSCGAAMDQRPEAMVLERAVEQLARPVEFVSEDEFDERDRHYWVWRELHKTGPLGGAEETMRFVIGQKSDTGRVRELDEDSMLALTMAYTRESVVTQHGLFVVADGMGGHEAGEIASQTAIEALIGVLMENILKPELGEGTLSPEQIQHWLRHATVEANDRVYLERQKRGTDMGTTITTALIRDWTLYLAHVGDCRAYRWSENGLEQLTADHSIVASMIAAGTAKPEEIYTHPQRSVIYRCIGDRATVDVDLLSVALSPGDRLVLCCDGLWEMVRNEGIEEVMLSESDPEVACDVLVDRANLAGGVDNISVIVVQL